MKTKALLSYLCVSTALSIVLPSAWGMEQEEKKKTSPQIPLRPIQIEEIEKIIDQEEKGKGEKDAPVDPTIEKLTHHLKSTKAPSSGRLSLLKNENKEESTNLGLYKEDFLSQTKSSSLKKSVPLSLLQEDFPLISPSERRETLKATILTATDAGEPEHEVARLSPPPEGFVRMRGEVFGDDSYLIPYGVALEILSRNVEGTLTEKAEKDPNEPQDEKGEPPYENQDIFNLSLPLYSIMHIPAFCMGHGRRRLCL